MDTFILVSDKLEFEYITIEDDILKSNTPDTIGTLEIISFTPELEEFNTTPSVEFEITDEGDILKNYPHYDNNYYEYYKYKLKKLKNENISKNEIQSLLVRFISLTFTNIGIVFILLYSLTTI